MKLLLVIFIFLVTFSCDSNIINETTNENETEDSQITFKEENNQTSTIQTSDSSDQTLESSSLILSETSVSLAINESKTITATALQENGSQDSISALSTNPEIASVIANNLSIYITGLSLGKTTIEIASESGQKVLCEITVSSTTSTNLSKPDKTISLNPEEESPVATEILLKDITLTSVHNFASFPLAPCNKNAISVFRPLIDSNSLNYVKDENGKKLYYNEEEQAWVNEIGNVSITEGYRIKVNQDVDLTIEGTSINYPLTIELHEGENYMPYLNEKAQDARTFFNGLIEEGSLIKVSAPNGDSLIYFLGSWRNLIGNLKPYQAYSVEVNQDTSLTLDSVE